MKKIVSILVLFVLIIGLGSVSAVNDTNDSISDDSVDVVSDDLLALLYSIPSDDDLGDYLDCIDNYISEYGLFSYSYGGALYEGHSPIIFGDLSDDEKVSLLYLAVDEGIISPDDAYAINSALFH